MEYEAGQTPDAALAAKYSITLSTLLRHVKRNGWTKRQAPDPQAVHQKANEMQIGGPEPAKDPNEHALVTAAMVVGIHRKDVARLRTISNTLVERLGLILSGTPAMMTTADGSMVPMVCLGARESPADLLEKLSRVLVRTTEIERQAYGLKAFNPEEAANEGELADELERITREVEEMANAKAKSDTTSSITNAPISTA